MIFDVWWFNIEIDLFVIVETIKKICKKMFRLFNIFFDDL